jgi:hypothetical protein
MNGKANKSSGLGLGWHAGIQDIGFPFDYFSQQIVTKNV